GFDLMPNPGSPPTITTLPAAPTRGEPPAVFSPKAATFVAALDPFGNQADALGAWMNSAANFVEAQTTIAENSAMSASEDAGTATGAAGIAVAAASSATLAPGTS